MSYQKIKICDWCQSVINESTPWLERKTKYTHKQLHACNWDCSNKYDNKVRMMPDTEWVEVKPGWMVKR